MAAFGPLISDCRVHEEGRRMNLRALDLNLLVVFDAVMQDRSVTKAAERLHMAQPALSHALGRLRQALGDELFIRTPEGMTPTPKAESLGDGVRVALSDLRMILGSAEPFEPASAERRFAIAVNNHAALVLAPPLAAAAREEAPGVLLDFRPSGTLDLVDRLDRGELDLVIGETIAPADRFRDIRLHDDGFAVLMRRGHVASAPGALTMARFAALPHLIVTSSREGIEFVDETLARQGLSRRIALGAPLAGHPGGAAAIGHGRGHQRTSGPGIRAHGAAGRRPPAVSVVEPDDRHALASPGRRGPVASVVANPGAAHREDDGLKTASRQAERQAETTGVLPSPRR
jgi:DNA-binding transcriptional LysR family regulator